MSKIKIYYNPGCSKCRQTKGILDEQGLDYTLIEYLNDTPDASELTSILDTLGMQPLEIIRTGEAVFKELGLSASDERSAEEWIKIMVENPILIQRPIVINGDDAAVCRPAEGVLDIL